MIVVIGRPGLARATDAGTASAGEQLDGLAAGIALASVASGARVELVGSIGDDADGDLVAVLLGRAGIGHAALLRDPAGRTPVRDEDPGPAPRLDAGDVGLGLGYLADVRVMVAAEPLPPEAEAALIEAAGFHGASIVAILPVGTSAASDLAETATVLEAPDGDLAPFTEMVGRYATALDAGTPPDRAFTDATAAAGWERTGE